MMSQQNKNDKIPDTGKGVVAEQRSTLSKSQRRRMRRREAYAKLLNAAKNSASGVVIPPAAEVKAPEQSGRGDQGRGPNHEGKPKIPGSSPGEVNSEIAVPVALHKKGDISQATVSRAAAKLSRYAPPRPMKARSELQSSVRRVLDMDYRDPIATDDTMAMVFCSQRSWESIPDPSTRRTAETVFKYYVSLMGVSDKVEKSVLSTSLVATLIRHDPTLKSMINAETVSIRMTNLLKANAARDAKFRPSVYHKAIRLRAKGKVEEAEELLKKVEERRKSREASKLFIHFDPEKTCYMPEPVDSELFEDIKAEFDLATERGQKDLTVADFVTPEVSDAVAYELNKIPSMCGGGSPASWARRFGIGQNRSLYGKHACHSLSLIRVRLVNVVRLVSTLAVASGDMDFDAWSILVVLLSGAGLAVT